MEDKQVHGIAPQYLEEIKEALTSGKKAMLIRSNLQTKYGTNKKLPTLQQLRTCRATLVKNKESRLGMQYLTDITAFIEKHFVTTREEFFMKGLYFFTNSLSCSMLMYLFSYARWEPAHHFGQTQHRMD